MGGRRIGKKTREDDPPWTHRDLAACTFAAHIRPEESLATGKDISFIFFGS